MVRAAVPGGGGVMVPECSRIICLAVQAAEAMFGAGMLGMVVAVAVAGRGVAAIWGVEAGV